MANIKVFLFSKLNETSMITVADAAVKLGISTRQVI